MGIKILSTIKRHYYSMTAKADMTEQDNATAEIMLYEQIGKDYWSDEGVSAKDFATDLKSLGPNIKNIHLRIHSPGGSVFEGLAIYDNLKAHSAKKTVTVDGVAASMAAYIAMVGDTVNMPENAMMMIHGPQAIASGNSQDMRDMADTLDKCAESLTAILKTRCNASDAEIKDMLAKDTWLTAQDCKAMGLCDNVTDELKMAAHLDLSRFNSVPKALLDMMQKRKETDAGAGGLSSDLSRAVSSQSDSSIQAASSRGAITNKRKELTAMEKCPVCGAPLTEGQCLACAKATAQAVVAANKNAEEKIKIENSRREEIHALGQQHRCSHLAQKAIVDGTTADEFKAIVLRTVYNAKAIVDPTASTLGMDQAEIESYSIVRAIRQIADRGQLEGIEKDASEATAKLCKREAKGFFIPTDIMRAHRVNQIKAALNQTTSTSGGYLTGTDVLVSDMIELLRNKTLISQMGARSLGGLVGNVMIPRVNGGATAYWLNESGTVSESDQSFGQLGLVPKRLVGDTAYQKELMMQTSLDVEGFVREDLMRILAIAKDYAALFGTGGSQPLGIFNTTGIGSVTFGAAATWAKVLDFETQIATANADVATMGFITSPGVRAKWKAATKIATSQYSDFLWEKGSQAGSGIVNSYRAEVTNQIPNSGTYAHRVIMANFADLLLADWAGIDVVVDPYSLKKQGQIEITVTLWTDFGIRHVGSVCISSDSGAQ